MKKSSDTKRENKNHVVGEGERCVFAHAGAFQRENITGKSMRYVVGEGNSVAWPGRGKYHILKIGGTGGVETGCKSGKPN